MLKMIPHPLRVVVFFALVACGPKPTAAPLAIQAMSIPQGALPHVVTPILYDISLTLDPALDRYHGRVSIALQVHRATTTVWMHGRDLAVQEATVRGADGQKMTAVYQQVSDDGVVRLDLPQAVPAGLATLTIDFESAYSTQLQGLYRVVADKTPYVYTQFEPIAARRAFPCFDEPGYKTPFELTLNIPESLTAVSNTLPMGEQRSGDGTKTLVFMPTAPLPTYLVAMAVGPFEVLETTVPANVVRPDPLVLRGVAVRGQGNKLGYAVQHSGALIQGLERYFGAAYPFPKLDIIAVPDFAAGAMENAGAVTFRDWLLLLEPSTMSQMQVRSFVYVVAHEFAHQWFGDDVTMPWWNDLWLNEAFATWMGYRVAAEWDPKLQLDLQFINGIHGAMGVDALAHARKIHQPCNNHDDIHNAFDSITYLKGGGVLRMFESYVGAEKFQTGVRQHVRAHHFGNADSTMFLRALEAGSETPGLADDFSTFLDQPGVPNIRVALDCNTQPASMTLTQSRYKPVGSQIDENATWRVPVCWRLGSADAPAERACVLLGEATQRIDLPRCPTWLMPDADAAGYYHWQMDKAALAALRQAPLTPAEQLSVASNLGAAFAAASSTGRDVLEALVPLTAAKVYQVSVAPLGVFDFSLREILSEEARPAARRWMRALYAPKLKALGMSPKPNEDGEQSLWRRQLLRFFAESLRDPVVLTALQARGEAFLGYGYDGKLHPEAVSADLADMALVAAANARGPGFTEMLIFALKHCDDASLRRQLIAALARITEPQSAARVRELSLDPALRLNEITSVVSAQLYDVALRDTAWVWFKDNFEALRARLPGDHLGTLPSLAAGFCSVAARDDVEAFFKDKVSNLSGAPRALAQALEAISLCEAQVAAQGDSVRAFFE